jgi:uncharacterized peroxidase-related enzyme
LNALANVLLHDAHSLTQGERELIATYVSSLNDTKFCATVHGAVAAVHLGDEAVVAQVKRDFRTADVSPKLKALLTIAGQVTRGGRHVTSDAVEAARQLGATDLEIHDTVLIAAAFCMYNRYVDGLQTFAPDAPEAYRAMGAELAAMGYPQPETQARPAGAIPAVDAVRLERYTRT